jgi:hypothetical protein
VRRVPWELAALPALGIARLLPTTGFGLGLRLTAATACLLLPGALVARALGRPSCSAALAWSLATLFAASAVVFAVHGSLVLTLVLYAAVGAAALAFAWRRTRIPSPATGGVLLLGLAFGIALWHVAPGLGGDALFHLARIRKLDAFGSLSLRTVDEFKDGGLHPGYAFPLWHVLLALVGKIGGADPALVLRHEATALAPLAFAVSYEAGRSVFRSAWAGVAVMVAQVTIIGLAAGNGGSYTSLALPATAARQVLVPAVIALFFEWLEARAWIGLAAVAAASLGLVVVHPTYALFVAIPLVGFVAARALFARTEVLRGIGALAAVAVPAGLFTLWLLPIVRETVSHDPSPAQRLRDLHHYQGQVDVYSLHRFRLAPELFARTGAVTVAALALVPLAALAARRRWSAYVVGGSLVVLAISLVPALFPHFSDAVSLSQARRAAGFVPFAFAFAGGALVLARLLSWLVLPVALAAGIVLQLVYPGNFEYGGTGGPALAAWIAAYGGAAALVVGAVLGRRGSLERRDHLAALAAAVFVVPVAVDGFSSWSPVETKQPLTDGLVQALRTDVPKGAVVFSDDDTSYRIAAVAPIYVANALPGHVADTKANRPYARRADARAFFRTGNLEIPRRYGAQYLVVNRRRSKLRLTLRRLYADSRYALYRL